MRIGIVCPYSLDRPGGVQLHVTDLADALIDRGHFVSVLAPAAPHTVLPPYVKSAGRSISVRYNGATARLTFGLIAAMRVRSWLRDGKFDVVHIHEPGAASIGVIAMWARLGPTVATFHTSNDDSRIMRLAKPFIKPGYELLDARIAVSASAANTIRDHLRIEATDVIPNGVHTVTFRSAPKRPLWSGTPDAPTIGILGRMDEPRKGLDVFLDMIPTVRAAQPKARFLVAGRYSERTATRIRKAGAEAIGPLNESQKSRFMASLDVYCAPNTGGESFGIVLVEAMASGAAVVASDLPAFQDVATMTDGQLAVALHRNEDAEDLGQVVAGLLANPSERAALAKRGEEWSKVFDWAHVAPLVEDTYEEAIRMDAEFRPAT